MAANEGKNSQHTREHNGDDHEDGQMPSHDKTMYLRFVAMILTGMVVMYLGSYEWSHVRWSESRLFMTMTMGGAMGLVMLSWMITMYKNAKANVAIVIASALLLAGGVALDRSQVTIDDRAFLNAMIPHHSLAITRSERFNVTDVRVCELAVEISEAQRREISEMEWLIKDIEESGPATTSAEAEARPVPDFHEPALRDCTLS